MASRMDGPIILHFSGRIWHHPACIWQHAKRAAALALASAVLPLQRHLMAECVSQRVVVSTCKA